jgi:phosphoglycerate dehydrogenase-like enzyme
LDAARLGHMEHGASLLDAARRRVVDESALVAALQSCQVCLSALGHLNPGSMA